MRILVLGASGSIGNAIVRELVAHGYDVTGSARAAELPVNLHGLDIRYRPGDAMAAGVFDDLCRGQDVVVDAATPYSLNLLTSNPGLGRRPVEQARLRVGRLIEAAMRHDAALIHLSSAYTEARSASGTLWSVQQKLFRALHPYFAIKRLTEDRIREAMDAGLAATILRPTACIGPWDVKRREDCWIPKLVNGEIPGILSHRVNVIDTRDVARAVRGAIASGDRGATFTVVGHNTTSEHLIGQLCEAAGVHAPGVRIPAELSVLPLLWIEALWAGIGSVSPLPALVPALLCEQTWLDADGSGPSLGIVPRPLHETASDTVSWYRAIAYC